MFTAGPDSNTHLLIPQIIKDAGELLGIELGANAKIDSAKKHFAAINVNYAISAPGKPNLQNR